MFKFGMLDVFADILLGNAPGHNLRTKILVDFGSEKGVLVIEASAHQ